MRPILLLLALTLAAPWSAAAAPPAVDPDLLAGIKARAIGPAAMSGRVAAIDAVESDPDVVYVGAATGGVWKSTNGGLTWMPVFDDQPVAAIGAVAIFQPNPDIVWVGTGEGNPRNSVSIGNGVYRSLDGGRTWKHLGLEATERIHRIVLHPRNPDVAWVAALGRAWGENPERGVFKTTDGGRTWRKVLYADERTGAADLVMDPANPDKLFAALWQYRRWPWFFRSGGPGSGLHVSHDGGESWRRLTEEDGLPKGELGRIGVAISRSDPNVVYALVENAARNAVLRSDDGGRTWQKVHDEDPDVTERPFYYADLRVDPARPHRVYSLASRARVSEDGGKTWKGLGRSREIHGDYHALWINPADPTHMVIGNDGGLGISRDRGETWYFPGNLPLAQYYHVAVDMERPYNVYGGMQDNGSWRGPNATWEDGAIRNQHWVRVGMGDGFDTLPDPADATAGYSMWQGGNLMRWNLKTGERKFIRPPDPDPGEGGGGREKLRFNWNAGLATDPFDPAVVYYGSQYLHRSADRGETWTAISPDLTTDNPEWQRQNESGGLTLDVTAAENFTTIVAVAPSKRQEGVIWVGTDDGRIHVTRDGGTTWTSVEKNLRGVPENTWVPHIEPSDHDPATAFVVLDNHRRSDFNPYVFRTGDWGKTWKSLATSDLRGYALAIEQDPVDPDLLFLGTEFGLWVSTDAGRRWMRWKHGVPTVSVMDLVVHPREGDLVMGTHGRAAFVIDDVGPLRELTPSVLDEPLHLFKVPDAQQFRQRVSGGNPRSGAGEFQGENEPYGALLTYSLDFPDLPLSDQEKERARKQAEREKARATAAAEAAPPETRPRQEDLPPPGERPGAQAAEAPEEPEEGKKDKGPKVEIRILDAAGKEVRKLEGPAHRGVNRAVWDLGRNRFRQPPRPEQEFSWRNRESGPQVPPGTYTVVVRFRDQEARGTVRVLPDPLREKQGEAAWQQREAAIERIRRLQEPAVGAIERVIAARDDAGVVIARARKAADGEEGQGANRELQRAARQLRASLDAVERKLWTPPSAKGLLPEDDALSRIDMATGSIESSWDPPNQAQETLLRQVESEVAAALAEVDRLFAGPVAELRKQAEAAGIGLLSAGPAQPAQPGG